VTEKVSPVTSAEDLSKTIELIDVWPYEVSAKRKGEPTEPPSLETLNDTDAELVVQFSRDDDRLIIRLRLPVDTSDAEFLADIGVVYELPTDIQVEPAVIAEFVSKVAVFAAYPFVREAIFGMATRLRVTPPVLGIIRAHPRPGDFARAASE